MTIEQMRTVENAQTKYIVNFLAKEIETDNYLAECIANTKLSIKDCMKYIKNEVKKKAIDNMAMIEDAEVYALAKHFYLEHKTFENSKNKSDKNVVKPIANTDAKITKESKQVKESEVIKKPATPEEPKPIKKTKAEIKEEALHNLYGGGLFD